MKKYILSLIIIIIASKGYGQKNNADVYRGYVRYESATTPGTVTVISTGFAKKKAESIQDACREAFYTLLFRGIPGSQYELPMIPDENGKKDDPVILSLLDGGYSSFITGNDLQSEDSKKKGKDGAKGVMTINKITISCDALRRYLEQNKVIRKFGI